MSGTSSTGKRDYVDIAIRYASDMVLGHRPSARLTRLSAQRFLDDLKRSDLEEWDYTLDEGQARRVCSFVEKFPLVKGGARDENGQLRRGGRIVLLDWQIFILVNLYGWVDSLGLRRFRTGYIETPKKQGKSTWLAPLGLYGLCMDDEEGAEVYCAAVGRDQARIVWNIAKQMAMKTPAWTERYGVELLANAVVHAGTGSTFQALSREGKSLEGKNPSLSLVDELHRHQTREVWDILDESREARSQSLMLAITNTGSDKASVCYEQRTYLIKVLEGYRDDSYFGMIYTIDPEDEENWLDETVWHKAQPSLGRTVSVDGLRRLARAAAMMPSKKAAFMRYQLGVWTSGEHAWLTTDSWRRCISPRLSAECEELQGRECYLGVDLASKKDLAALVAVFRSEEGKLQVIWRLYLPAARLDDNPMYRGWHEQGLLVATPGSTTDFAEIEADLQDWSEWFAVHALFYDPYNATQFATRASEYLDVVEFRQNARNYSEPMKELERMVVQQDADEQPAPEIECMGSPTLDDPMSWMVGNVVVQPDRNENVFPRKERAENKIDGPVAMIMAASGWITRNAPKKKSKYSQGAGLGTV